MTWLFILLTMVVLASIVWAVVALTRRGAGEPFTLATAVSAYAHLLVVVGAVLATAGAATLLKAGIGYANLDYAYASHRFYLPDSRVPSDTADSQRQDRSEDLALGAALALVGALALGAHIVIATLTRRLPAGSPTWTVRGAPLLLAVVSALVGLSAAAKGAFNLLRYAFVAPIGGSGRAPFAEPIAYAIMFLAVWLATTLWLVRTARRPDRPAIAPSYAG